MLETDLGPKTWPEPQFNLPIRHKLFGVASGLARSGTPANDGTNSRKYSGVYEGPDQDLQIHLSYSHLAGEERVEVSIGEDYRGTVKRVYQANTSVSDQHQVVGNLPINTLAILSNLEPQN